MAQVIRGQQKPSGLSEILGIGGAVVGGYYGSAGGAGGAIAGASGGAALGQTAGGIIDPQKPSPDSVQSGSQASAMQRKLQAQSQDNLAILKQAEANLPRLPEALRQQYAPAIIQARMYEEGAVKNTIGGW